MLENILRAVDFYYYKLKKQFEELQKFYYYQKDYLELIHWLKDYFEEKYRNFLKESKDIRKKIDLEKKTISIYYDEKEYKTIATFFLNFVGAFSYFISSIKNVNNTPFHPANFILIEKYILKDSKFIILPIPDDKLNYAYGNTPTVFKDYWKRSFKEREIEIFHLFLIPSFNREDIFINSTLGHEIGHYLIYQFSIWNEIEKKLLAQNIIGQYKIETFAEKEINQLSDEEKSDSMKKRDIRLDLFKDWRIKLKRWAIEIISDLIGLKIFGLPLFFAIMETIFLTNPRSSGDEKHPPMSERIKYMISEIEKDILKPLIKLIYNDKNKVEIKIGVKVKERIDYIKNEIFNYSIELKEFDKSIMDTINNAEFQKIIQDQIEILLKDNNIKRYIYDQKNLKDITDLMKLLEYYVTPNELIVDNTNFTTEPAEILTILNAGWFFYLFKLEIHYKLFGIEEDNFEKKSIILQKLNNLILKAIELSNIHKKSKEILLNKYGNE